jgi:uncharacterized protein YjiS (DUF1127 family)
MQMQSGAHAPPGGENMFKILTLSPTGEDVSSSKSWFGRTFAAVVAEWKARRAIRALGSMDERMLRDIGINRDQIWYVARHGRGAMWWSLDQRPDHTRWS